MTDRNSTEVDDDGCYAAWREWAARVEQTGDSACYADSAWYAWSAAWCEAWNKQAARMARLSEVIAGYEAEDHRWLEMRTEQAGEIATLRADTERMTAEIAMLGFTSNARCEKCGIDLGLREGVRSVLCGQCWHDSYRCDDTLCRAQWISGEGEASIRTRAIINGWTPKTEENKP